MLAILVLSLFFSLLIIYVEKEVEKKLGCMRLGFDFHLLASRTTFLNFFLLALSTLKACTLSVRDWRQSYGNRHTYVDLLDHNVMHSACASLVIRRVEWTSTLLPDPPKTMRRSFCLLKSNQIKSQV